MDRETIIKAISDPTLVRRAFAAIREDPGPLKLMLSERESLLGYDVSYRYYTSGNRDIIVASDFGPLEPRMGVMYSIGRAAKYINRVGRMDTELTVSCLAVTSDPEIYSHSVVRYPISAECVLPDGSCTRQRFKATEGWIALILGPDADNMEAIVRDLERNMAVDFGAVGARIRACRLEAGMSQERLAELSDLSTPYVSHIERMAKKPSLSALIRLSAALGVTVDYLLAGSQPADQTAFLSDVQTLLSDCSLTERRIVLQVALATREALRQAGVVT